MIEVERQPTETTCGPTALHAIYRFWGDELPLLRVVEDIHELDGGGTLGVSLANHALERGYRVTLYTYNLQVFDPTWFDDEGRPTAVLRARLSAQLEHKRDAKLHLACRAFDRFVELGGQLRLEDISTHLIRRHLRAGTPLLCGLSATYLYRSAREVPDTTQLDDLRGESAGHFVVLAEEDRATKTVGVADPYPENPYAQRAHYHVPFSRLVGAIYLGVSTYDGNLLCITPSAHDEKDE
ncbi:MAG: hypothetical protein KF901_21165 [Myxococcales bacterium]|nr:hypothetical protein [Myxococcales bacterium]